MAERKTGKVKMAGALTATDTNKIVAYVGDIMDDVLQKRQSEVNEDFEKLKSKLSLTKINNKTITFGADNTISGIDSEEEQDMSAYYNTDTIDSMLGSKVNTSSIVHRITPPLVLSAYSGNDTDKANIPSVEAIKKLVPYIEKGSSYADNVRHDSQFESFINGMVNSRQYDKLWDGQFCANVAKAILNRLPVLVSNTNNVTWQNPSSVPTKSAIEQITLELEEKIADGNIHVYDIPTTVGYTNSTMTAEEITTMCNAMDKDMQDGVPFIVRFVDDIFTTITCATVNGGDSDYYLHALDFENNVFVYTNLFSGAETLNIQKTNIRWDFQNISPVTISVSQRSGVHGRVYAFNNSEDIKELLKYDSTPLYLNLDGETYSFISKKKEGNVTIVEYISVQEAINLVLRYDVSNDELTLHSYNFWSLLDGVIGDIELSAETHKENNEWIEETLTLSEHIDSLFERVVSLEETTAIAPSVDGYLKNVMVNQQSASSEQLDGTVDLTTLLNNNYIADNLEYANSLRTQILAPSGGPVAVNSDNRKYDINDDNFINTDDIRTYIETRNNLIKTVCQTKAKVDLINVSNFASAQDMSDVKALLNNQTADQDVDLETLPDVLQFLYPVKTGDSLEGYISSYIAEHLDDSDFSINNNTKIISLNSPLHDTLSSNTLSDQDFTSSVSDLSVMTTGATDKYVKSLLQAMIGTENLLDEHELVTINGLSFNKYNTVNGRLDAIETALGYDDTNRTYPYNYSTITSGLIGEIESLSSTLYSVTSRKDGILYVKEWIDFEDEGLTIITQNAPTEVSNPLTSIIYDTYSKTFVAYEDGIYYNNWSSDGYNRSRYTLTGKPSILIDSNGKTALLKTDGTIVEFDLEWLDNTKADIETTIGAVASINNSYIEKLKTGTDNGQAVYITPVSKIADLSGTYYTKTEVNSLISNLNIDPEDLSALSTLVENLGEQGVSNLATKTELDAKVDKIDGKGLSTNDFTTSLKTKLESLPIATNIASATNLTLLTGRVRTLESAGYITGNALNDYATQGDVATAIANSGFTNNAGTITNAILNGAETGVDAHTPSSLNLGYLIKQLTINSKAYEASSSNRGMVSISDTIINEIIVNDNTIEPSIANGKATVDLGTLITGVSINDQLFEVVDGVATGTIDVTDGIDGINFVDDGYPLRSLTTISNNKLEFPVFTKLNIEGGYLTESNGEQVVSGVSQLQREITNNQNDLPMIANIAGVLDLVRYYVDIPVNTTALSNTTISLSPNTLYRTGYGADGTLQSVNVLTLNFVIPTNSRTNSSPVDFMWHYFIRFKTGATPSITFGNSANVKLPEGFSWAANTEYDVHITYDGVKYWVYPMSYSAASSSPSGVNTKTSDITVVNMSTTTATLTDNSLTVWDNDVASLDLKIDTSSSINACVYSLRFKTASNFSSFKLQVPYNKPVLYPYDITWNVNTDYEVSILYDCKSYSLKQVALQKKTSTKTSGFESYTIG